ncbi:phBC6A51 family helix-turn-helix protein [Jeotgalibacillus malaysiensis]|uniref:phBC6A51 family helix-turn-helix protein n=1 Tax=Jeotgalibacillus malaysiensis TaxID=1508404 RepID=UPI003850B29F
MLRENQIKAIELIVHGNKTVTAIAEEVGVSRKTFYEWMKKQEFRDMLNEMTELKSEFLREAVKGNVEEYIDSLEQIRKTTKNDMARYHTTTTLLNYAGWLQNQKQEISINKEDKEEKNVMLDMLNEKE